ncbi:MAG: glutamate synthase large subunit [Phycisphaerales bacterium]|nr:glutamate synthase large subunit [Phycisphaerales bacterium]
MQTTLPLQGLYDPQFEHDNCGVGAVVDLHGRRSHAVVELGRQVLTNLLHRGATGGDACTGDGAGILLQMPHDGLAAAVAEAGVTLPAPATYGVGMLFVERTADLTRVRTLVAAAADHHGLPLRHWRPVPVKSEVLGDTALASEPLIAQFFLDGGGLRGEELERRLYLVRRRIERLDREAHGGPGSMYICSLSCRNIVYKGLFMAPQLFEYFTDLSDELVRTAYAIVHQRYSTNTFPSWPLAQPFRLLAHNGEINTLRGNLNRMRAREPHLASSLLGEDLTDLRPVVMPGTSDSGALDNVLELLVRAGRTLPHAAMMLIPEAYGPQYHMSADKRAFYDYHAAIMEPWDGPAAVVFADGRYVGALLDRNGLRPGRYVVTNDGLVVLASEAGVVEFPAERIQRKGRLQPGRLFLVDLQEERIVGDNELKSRIARQQPYRRWLEQNRLELRGLFAAGQPVAHDTTTIMPRLRMFGYTREELQLILVPMARHAQEPVGSMGTDTPLAVLSQRPKLLFEYFRQQFAQVTNPAIDPLREGLVMSLTTFAGRDRNLLDETPEHCRKLRLAHPILTNDDLDRLRGIDRPDLRVATIDAVWQPDAGDLAGSFERGLAALVSAAEEAVRRDLFLLIISDRAADAHRAPLPILLAVAAVHHGLLARGLRDRVGLIVESGEPREVMHFCLLCGYGASAINPYLAFETLYELQRQGDLPAEREPGEYIAHTITAIKKGILKTISKMGISTLQSYRGAQLFEIVGLAPEITQKYFPGTPSRVSGIGLATLAEEYHARHRTAFEPPRPGTLPLEFGGEYHYRADGEQHAWNPQTVHLLQHAVRRDDYGLYERFADRANTETRNLQALRGLLDFVPATPVPLHEVENAAAIMQRFCTGAMSHGSIGAEVHQSLAIAMNRLGAASNTGEGGEDPRRYYPQPGHASANSAIKQVASGRFGVTIEYLSAARELQIKVAQGAKPGEGGQLPGFKVTDEIARLRHSTPGVTLISPPPHHDIYSIEDLAQLIHDLRAANPIAEISVKLVSEAGVGTVAAGVAKAAADEVLISGHEGGTGASPLSSIRYAGTPWELGLAETQQTLVLNDLRGRIRVQVDGGLRTGRDVIIAALLGAERFGFGTAALVTQGCILMRKCHLGTCPVGIATQDPRLRERFAGQPEHAERYLRFVAEDVRRWMAQLGFRRIDELVGRVDRLVATRAADFWKTRGLDLTPLLVCPDVPADRPIRRVGPRRIHAADPLEAELLAAAAPALDRGEPVRVEFTIRNVHRTIGATLSHHLVRRHGAAGLPENSVECLFRGSAGQSFGAFLAPGILFRLIGEANDYLGKGLSGGRIIVQPPEDAGFEAHENVIAGNTLLYGATSGEVLINGAVGERFAVRNSGATAVVEAVGDHGCEYMTGGTVVVLGPTGRNFAAGMSGGTAYVLDEHQLFDTLCNLDMVDLESVHLPAEQVQLRRWIDHHRRWTGSERARRILDDWPEMVGRFVKVVPIEYRRALARQSEEEAVASDALPATEEVFRG